MEETKPIEGTQEHIVYKPALDLYGVMYLFGFLMLCAGLALVLGPGWMLTIGGALLVITALFETLIGDWLAARGDQ